VPETTDFQSWGEAQEYPIPLNSAGKIIDCLNPDKKRPNTPEERIRQRMAQILHHEFG